MDLQPGDVFLTKGDSWISKAIRIATRSFGESRTQVNHVGVVVSAGTESSATIVEASSKVVTRSIHAYYKSTNTKVAIYRRYDLTQDEKNLITRTARSYDGAEYGYVKIALHFLDWMFGGIYFFRRLARMDNYPICSWVVAYSFAPVPISFGVKPNAADPDDIWDWVTESDDWIQIHPLELLRKEDG